MHKFVYLKFDKLIKLKLKDVLFENNETGLIMTQSPHIVSRTEVLPAICSDHSVPCAYIRNSVIKNKPFKRI